MVKDYAIITASDEKYGAFLVNHWLHSLRDNVDCRKIDIVVLDYGLKETQKNKLVSQGVIVLKCKREGHIVNVRYRDILRFLSKNYYKQIMLCDGGDIIFQTDISSLFEKNKNDYRAICEENEYAGENMIEYAILKRAFTQKFSLEISSILNKKKPINGGLIIGSYSKINKLCENMNKLILNKKIYGPDQVILNYTLYNEGFKELDRKFNYTLFSMKTNFKVKKGVFFEDNEKIAVVHNSGSKQIFRVISNFGYGPNHNKVKWVSYFFFKLFHKTFNLNFILRNLRKIILNLRKGGRAL